MTPMPNPLAIPESKLDRAQGISPRCFKSSQIEILFLSQYIYARADRERDHAICLVILKYKLVWGHCEWILNSRMSLPSRLAERLSTYLQSSGSAQLQLVFQFQMNFHRSIWAGRIKTPFKLLLARVPVDKHNFRLRNCLLWILILAKNKQRAIP